MMNPLSEEHAKALIAIAEAQARAAMIEQEHRYQTKDSTPLTPFGEAEQAARMSPEDEAAYWRGQYQHAERQREEMSLRMDRILHRLTDAEATIRTLLRLFNERPLR